MLTNWSVYSFPALERRAAEPQLPELGRGPGLEPSLPVSTFVPAGDQLPRRPDRPVSTKFEKKSERKRVSEKKSETKPAQQT